MISLRATVWAARILIVAFIVLLCVLARSPFPSWGVAIAWSPNGLFLAMYEKGILHFPRILERVHAFEPVLYRWLGVGLVKRIVANRVWPRIHGIKPPPLPKDRGEFLVRIEHGTKLAEICHAATFVLAAGVAGYYAATGRNSAAIWITLFNVALNAYPVMLQRSNRFRLQQSRASMQREPARAA